MSGSNFLGFRVNVSLNWARRLGPIELNGLKSAIRLVQMRLDSRLDIQRSSKVRVSGTSIDESPAESLRKTLLPSQVSNCSVGCELDQFPSR